MASDKRMYAINVLCKNCSTPDRVDIPYGARLETAACRVCGCLTLTKAMVPRADAV